VVGVLDSGTEGPGFKLQSRRCLVIIIIINRFVKRRKVVTSEPLGPGSVLVSRERRESLNVVSLRNVLSLSLKTANCSHLSCLCSPSSKTGSSPLKGCGGNCGPGGK